MTVLIDTQAIIWFAENNSQLSQTAKRIIEDSQNDCLVSIASLWEMAIKINLGKLNFDKLSLSEFMEEISENGFITFDIKQNHILQNVNLPLHHRDPFDRILISQAISENLPIISSDIAFDKYPIQRIW